MDLYEVQLPSGRVARYRQLSATECDDVADAATSNASPNMSMTLFTRKKNREGAKAMLVQITTDPVPLAVEETTMIAQLEMVLASVTATIDAKAEVEALMAKAKEQLAGRKATTTSYVVDEKAFVKADPEKFESDISAKDSDALGMLYAKLHELSPGEVGAMLGKVRQVTTA